MRYLGTLSLVLLSGLIAVAVHGSGAAVGKARITRDCGPVDDTTRIRWFKARGGYGGLVSWDKGVFDWRPLDSFFVPSAVLMTFDGGKVCVAGRSELDKGVAFADYALPCATNRYVLDVVKSPDTIVNVVRSIPRSENGSCDTDSTPLKPIDRFSGVERVTVAVFQGASRKSNGDRGGDSRGSKGAEMQAPSRKALSLFSVVLDFSEFEQTAESELNQTYYPEEKPGQGGGSLSENGHWLKNQKTLRSVEIRLKREAQ